MKRTVITIAVLLTAAALYAQQQTAPATEQQYLSAIQANSRDTAAYNALLNLYNTQNRHKDRIQIALQAIKNLGDNADLYIIVGDEYKNLGDYAKSLVSYQFALKMQPNNANIYNRMGLTLLKLSNFHQAEAAFRAAVVFAGEGNAGAKGIYLNNLGVSFEARKEYDQAAYYFKQALRYNPTYTKASDNLARVSAYLQGGQPGPNAQQPSGQGQ